MMSSSFSFIDNFGNDFIDLSLLDVIYFGLFSFAYGVYKSLLWS